MRLRWAPMRFGPLAWSRGVVLDGAPGTWEVTAAVIAPGQRFGHVVGVVGFGLGSLAGVRVLRDDVDRVAVVFVGRLCLAFGWHLHYPGGAR